MNGTLNRVVKLAPTAWLTGLLIATAAFGEEATPPLSGGHTYTQYQIEVAKARFPGISSIVVEGKRYGSDEVVVLGSTEAIDSVLSVVEEPVMETGAWAAENGKSYLVRETFRSGSGRELGTISITFDWQPGQKTEPFLTTANSIAARMARSTLSDKNAIDPYPWDIDYGPNTYAQALTERVFANHPELLVVMMHVNVPNTETNVVIGSNIGRFGKRADEDDMRVVETGETNLEVSDDKERFETELPLHDAHGNRIGALGLVFKYSDGDDREALHARGRAIRDEIASWIPRHSDLFEPAP